MSDVESMELDQSNKRLKRTSLSPPPRPESDEVVIIITSSDGKWFANPRKVTIETSNLATLIIPEETRVLGVGKGLMIKVKRENNPSFFNLKKLGEYEIQCRIPRSQDQNVTYGLIGPFDPNLNVDELKADLKVMYSA